MTDRLKIYAVALLSDSASDQILHTYTVVARTPADAEDVVKKQFREEYPGRKINGMVVTAVSDDHLRLAYDALFTERGGWK